VSWLRLERYHLGEVDAGERAAVAAHLEACPACAACLARIEAGDAAALPPRPEARARGAPSQRGRIVALAAGGLALAAAIALYVGRPWQAGEVVPAGSTGSRVKGDGIAFSLVRDDEQRIVEAGGAFRDGDRFKALVTCPPTLHASFDVVVLDVDGVSFPLAPARGLECGNDVALPGAFRLTGTADETVCLLWREDGDVDREPLAKNREAGLGANALCKQLKALPR
jgi:hypothetical protein